jgi:hypothetical protein
MQQARLRLFFSYSEFLIYTLFRAKIQKILKSLPSIARIVSLFGHFSPKWQQKRANHKAPKGISRHTCHTHGTPHRETSTAKSTRKVNHYGQKG